MLAYKLLDSFFWVFHTALVVFNLTGWIPRRTRRLNLFTLAMTAFSWFGLGFWYGWGYCACTDWHWQVRQQLGYHDESSTYIHLLLLKLTGVSFDLTTVEILTLAGFLVSLVMSLILNIRDWRRSAAERKLLPIQDSPIG